MDMCGNWKQISEICYVCGEFGVFEGFEIWKMAIVEWVRQITKIWVSVLRKEKFVQVG